MSQVKVNLNHRGNLYQSVGLNGSWIKDVHVQTDLRMTPEQAIELATELLVKAQQAKESKE